MKRHKTWFSLGLIALSALALALVITILPAGAAHDDRRCSGHGDDESDGGIARHDAVSYRGPYHHDHR